LSINHSGKFLINHAHFIDVVNHCSVRQLEMTKIPKIFVNFYKLRKSFTTAITTTDGFQVVNAI